MKLSLRQRRQRVRSALLLAGVIALLGIAWVFGKPFFAAVVPPLLPPGPTSYTVDDIYNRLTTNAPATEGLHAGLPSGTPPDTLHTLKDVYEAIPPVNPSKVLSGTTYFGIRGAIPTKTLSPTTTRVASGFYAQTDLTTVDADLSAENIHENTGLFGIIGNFVKFPFGDNDPTRVLTTAENPGTYDATHLGSGSVKDGVTFGVNRQETGILQPHIGYNSGGVLMEETATLADVLTGKTIRLTSDWKIGTGTLTLANNLAQPGTWAQYFTGLDKNVESCNVNSNWASAHAVALKRMHDQIDRDINRDGDWMFPSVGGVIVEDNTKAFWPDTKAFHTPWCDLMCLYDQWQWPIGSPHWLAFFKAQFQFQRDTMISKSGDPRFGYGIMHFLDTGTDRLYEDKSERTVWSDPALAQAVSEFNQQYANEFTTVPVCHPAGSSYGTNLPDCKPGESSFPILFWGGSPHGRSIAGGSPNMKDLHGNIAMNGYLGEVKSLGGKTMINFNNPLSHWDGATKLAVQQRVQQYAHDPSVYGFLLADEPNLGSWVPRKNWKEFNDIVKRNAPDKYTWINYAANGSFTSNLVASGSAVLGNLPMLGIPDIESFDAYEANCNTPVAFKPSFQYDYRNPATPSDMLEHAQGWVNGVRIDGTMVDTQGDTTATVRSYDAATKRAYFTPRSGYFDGTDTVSLPLTFAEGVHVLKAEYLGTDVHYGSETTDLLHIIRNAAKADTTTIDVSSPSTSVFGQAGTITATVTTTSGNPTGTVTFYDKINGAYNVLGQASVNAAGTAQMPLGVVPVGSHTFVAAYGGDATHNASVTAEISHIVRASASPYETQMILLAPSNSTGQASLYLSGSLLDGTHVLGGPVKYYDVADDGTLTVQGSATMSNGRGGGLVNLSFGPRILRAVYEGNGTYKPSTAQEAMVVVRRSGGIDTNAYTSIQVTPSPSTDGGNVHLHVTAESFSGALTGSAPSALKIYDKVDGTYHLLRAQTLAADTAATDQTMDLDSTSLVPGAHIIAAVFAGNANRNPSVIETMHVVTDPAKSDTTTVLTTDPRPSHAGQGVTLSARVTGTGTPTGQVIFYEQERTAGSEYINQPFRVLGHADVENGVATLTVGGLSYPTNPSTDHYLMAVYSGSALHNASVSPGILHFVEPIYKNDTTTTLTADPAFSASTLGITLNAAVDATAENPSGTVNFYENVNGVHSLLGTSPVRRGSGALTVSPFVTLDSSLVSSNVKDGITILGVTGKSTIIQKTGQTAEDANDYSCGDGRYGSCDDAHYQHGADRVCTDNANGTVTSPTTLLQWQQCAAGLSGSDCGTGSPAIKSVQDAVSYCETLTLGGQSDWRLPNINELLTLVNYGNASGPMIDAVTFPHTPSGNFWSSTAQDASTFRKVDFGNGALGTAAVGSTLNVRCVRGG